MKRKNVILLFTSIIAVVGISVPILMPVLNKKYDTSSKEIFTVSFDTQGGTAIGAIKLPYGSLINVPNPEKNGYTFLGWTYKNQPWNTTINTVTENMILKANWEINIYTINYIFNGGHYEEDYLTTFTVESSFDLITPEKLGYQFCGWTDENGNILTEISTGMVGNLTLSAQWTDKIKIMNEDPTKSSIVVKFDLTDQNIAHIQYVPKNNLFHLFNGFYNENDELLSMDFSFTVNLTQESNKSIFINYLTNDEEINWNNLHGVTPIQNDENIITYGMYPQTNIQDNELIAKLENESLPTSINDYVYYGGNYYIKKKSSLYKDDSGNYLDDHSFDSGTEMVDDNYYWFKVEPIEWLILEEKTSIYTLLSKNLLDVTEYYSSTATRQIDNKLIYPNNYMYSNLRTWLNDTFFNRAFYFNATLILETKVNNDPTTTAFADNPFTCDDTLDMVFELSYYEYNSKFDSNKLLARHYKTTDFARTSFALYEDYGKNKYCGYTWTRSPHTNGSQAKNVSRINKAGGINYCWCGANYSCAQPCINIFVN